MSPVNVQEYQTELLFHNTLDVNSEAVDFSGLGTGA